uniref:Nucleoporin NUP35 n=1 Tax=Calidris pygmaea TaxID=425635 RepID=A0A8C3JH32_9CHAR
MGVRLQDEPGAPPEEDPPPLGRSPGCCLGAEALGFPAGGPAEGAGHRPPSPRPRALCAWAPREPLPAAVGRREAPQGRPLPGPGCLALHLFPFISGGSPLQPLIPTHKDKSGAPPVRSLCDELCSPGLGSTPLSSRIPVSGLDTGLFLAENLDPFYTQGDSLTSEDQLDGRWVTVYGFNQASASYILHHFSQYGKILKHVMSNTGNWMHICYQTKLQARKALSKDGKIFGDCIRIGVKPCIDRKALCFWASSLFALTSFVVSGRQIPRKDESFLSKLMESVFGW